MENAWQKLTRGSKNFVLLGEAGCGKSEIAMALALYLIGTQERPVHFFDMDQTKPLFRSRDARAVLEEAGVVFHFEEQKADAPTQVGGVVPLLLDQEALVVMDVGGSDTGARLIGGLSHLTGREETAVFYVVNVYRPWSGDILAVDGTLSAVLKAARLRKFRLVANPNLGMETTAGEFLRGLEKTVEMLSPYASVEAAFVKESLYDEVSAGTQLPVLALRPLLSYPWAQA